MTGRVHDYPTRILVDSESESGDSYLVELADHPLHGLNEGIFNGSCTCAHFNYGEGRNPSLKKQLAASGYNKVCRCKHIRWAREHALDLFLPVLKQADKNIPDDAQV